MYALGRSSLIAIGLSVTVLAAGCGDDEPTGETGKVNLELVRASFPEHQKLAKPVTMSIVVRNPGNETVEMVTATVAPAKAGQSGSGFATNIARTDAGDRSRPIWIVDEAPANGVTADPAVVRGGPLEPGKTLKFQWKVMPVRSGEHSVRWQVGADVHGDQQVIGDDGEPIEGTFDVTVSQ